MKTKHKHARRRIVAVLSATLALGLGVMGIAGPAVAAPPYTTTGTVTDIAFNQATVQSGSKAELTAKWSIADNPTSPAGFELEIDKGLAGWGDKFDLKAPDGSTVGSCLGTGTAVKCDLDPQYITANPLNIHGTLSFWVTVNSTVTKSTLETYTFGSATASITVTPNTPAGQCTTDCEFNGLNNGKWANNFEYQNGYAIWGVNVQAPKEGMTAGQKVVIKDRPGADQEPIKTSDNPHLYIATKVTTGADGKERPDWEEVPRDQYEASDAGDEVTFTTEAGAFYKVYFTTKVLAAAPGKKYVNDADITIGSQHSVSVSADSTYSGGSGTGIGTNVGKFTITKKLAGDAADVLPSGLSYTGSYVVTASDGTTTDGTYSVKAGQSWTSPAYARDSMVTIKENAPTEPSNVTWGQPVFSSNDFKLAGGVTTPLTLTNTATKVAGEAAWTKVDPAGKALAGSQWSLTGPNGVVTDVVDNGANDVDPAVGAVKVSGLAWGAYTLKETQAPAGYVLSTESKTATITGSDLSVSFGAITNSPEGKTVLVTPSTPAQPSATTPAAPTTPAQPPLANTGIDSAGIAVGVLGFLALLLGGAITIAARKSSKH